MKRCRGLPGSFSSNRTARQSRETKEFKAGNCRQSLSSGRRSSRSRRTALNAPGGVSGFDPQLRDKREVIRLSVVDQEPDREFLYIAAPYIGCAGRLRSSFIRRRSRSGSPTVRMQKGCCMGGNGPFRPANHESHPVSVASMTRGAGEAYSGSSQNA